MSTYIALAFLPAAVTILAVLSSVVYAYTRGTAALEAPQATACPPADWHTSEPGTVSWYMLVHELESALPCPQDALALSRALTLYFSSYLYCKALREPASSRRCRVWVEDTPDGYGSSLAA